MTAGAGRPCTTWHGRDSGSRSAATPPIRSAVLLLDAGADVDAAERIDEGGEIFKATPLWRTLSGQRNYDLAEYLLDRGADPSPAVFAVTFAEGGRQGTRGCDLLDRFGADWEQTFHGRTPLMDLMYFKRPAASTWLLARGVDVNATDPHGRTALHFGAMRGIRADAVKALLDAGADPTTRDDAGKTPYDHAADNDREKLLDLLRP